MEKKKRKATKAQRERIKNMLESGLIDRDEAQEITSKNRNSASSSLALWEEMYSSKGQVIMDLIGQFYGWEPELRSQLPELGKVATKAVFWRWRRKAKAIIVVRPHDAYAIYDVLHPAGCLDHELRRQFLEPLAHLFVPQQFFPAGDTLIDPPEGLARQCCMSYLEERLEPLYERQSLSLWRRAMTRSLHERLPPGLADSLRLSFGQSIFYAAGFAAAGDTHASMFSPLMRLWHSGNFPLGFDKQGNLLVLVAD